MTKSKNIPVIKVNKSLKHISAQVLDVNSGKVLFQISDKDSSKKTKTERASESGKSFGQLLKKNKVNKLVFIKNKNKYCGRIKAMLEAIKAEGVEI